MGLLNTSLRESFRWSTNLAVQTVLVTASASVVVTAVNYGQRDLSEVEGQVEGAAIQTNLGGLRTAFAIDFLVRQVEEKRSGGAVNTMAPAQRNPFLLLHRVPANYAGEMRAQATGALPPGNWVFDPVCSCIGYKPLYPRWLKGASGEPMLWFQVSQGEPPFLLTPREPYVWKDMVVF